MFQSHSPWLLRLALFGLLMAAGCQRASDPAAPQAPTEPPPASLHVSGPYPHENLSVFLVHSPNQDKREFITLDQGLKEGVVKITEKAQEQVQELQIDNQSESPLFLQEGDRLQGGKQDRTIFASLVIPPKSGQMTVPTFCIEQSRWAAGEQGSKFCPTQNAALAPKATREAAKFDKSQQKVWDSVRDQKQAAAGKMLAGNTNSSLNETLDSPKVQKISEEFTKALMGALDEHPDAVGVAIVINGAIEEVDVYPNHSLLRKLYPRLLQSYALQARLEKDKGKDAKKVTSDEVEKFMAEGKAKEQRDETINADNKILLKVLAGSEAKCAETRYKGEPVHRQVLSKTEKAGN